MILKKNFKKISEYLWEIPKTFRKDMRVPARIYVSKKLFQETEDEALIQLINTTTMPGIVKYAIAMPDIHSGYGPPIGGVGAMELPEGVISPGFVGYDENCLSPDSKILLENGMYLPIKEISRLKNCKVKTLNFKRNILENVQPFNFFKKHNNPIIYQIITVSGERLKVTSDHPILTKQGMKKAKDLKNNELILVYPFKGVKYQNPSFKIILDEKDLRRTLKKLERGNSQGNAVSQILNHLNSRNLLPVRFNSPFLPSILKLMGFIFGDGVVTLGGGDCKNPQIQFYAPQEDLKEIQKDIKKLGFRPSRIFSRKRSYNFTNLYGKTYHFSQIEYRVKINSASLAYLFVALGTPFGLKSHIPYRIPKWIFKCPLWQKRLFLGALFGAEPSEPKALNKYNFYVPQLSIQKAKGLERNAKLFLRDIINLLTEFGIKTYKIKKISEDQYKGKQRKISGFRLQIGEEAENLIKFFEIINYEYNQKKQKEACLAANYLRRKLKVVNFRTEVRQEIRKEYTRGRRTILSHSLFGKSRWSSKKLVGNSRIAFNFFSFKEYKEKYSWGDQGLVWDEIERIEKNPYNDFVYDFTVNHPDHNFIANGFLVSNCGVRLLKSESNEKEIKPYLDKLALEIQKEVPSGLGRGRKIKLSIEQINKILEGGVPYLVEQGFGEKEDIENCEHRGRMEMADSTCLSQRAKNRGRDQLGTLGSGNHFCEIQKVEKIFEKEIAKKWGIFENQIVIMIHTGSRGLGHQNCTDYLRLVIPIYPKYGIKLPDKELACVPFNSPEGQRFFKAMSAACNFAWANRHMIMYYVRKAWKSVFGERTKLKLLYDVAHNIAKIEEHEVDGKKMKLIVHRKGATRAFPPGHLELSSFHQETGQVVIVPGSMGTPSYLLVGREKSKEVWHSVCHGAGRTMSRHAAIKRVLGYEVVKKLKEKGIIVKCHSMRGIAEEAPIAYKDIESVVEVVENAALAKKVAKLKPLAVIKGE